MLLARIFVLASCAASLGAVEPLGLDRAMAANLEAELQKIIKGTRRGDTARYLDVFAPLRTELAALSPDGTQVAYTARTGEEVHLQMVDAERPDKIKTRVRIYVLEKAETAGEFYEVAPMRALQWVSADRLVFDTRRSFSLRNRHALWRIGEVTGIDADGANVRSLASPPSVHVIDRGISRPAHIRLLGPDSENTGTILISAHARLRGQLSPVIFQKYETYRLNTKTTERTFLGGAMIGSRAICLLDGLGRPRVEVEVWDNQVQPTPLVHRPADRPDQILSLDKIAQHKGFAFAPESILGERSVPLGFDDKGDTLYYASNAGRDTFGLYAVNLLTGEHLADLVELSGQDLLSPRLGTFDAAQYFGFERTNGDEFDRRDLRWGGSPQLVFDRFTRELAGLRYEADTRTAIWLRPELRAVQQQLAAARPGRSAEIMEWDESLNRILVREQGPADPGSFYLLDRAAGTYRELTRRGADPDSGSVARLTPFAFTLPDGSKIDGLLALPKESKLKRIPLVLLCPDLPWHRRGASYLPEFEALTRMGLAVAIYNGRGAWGTGIKERRKLAVNPDEVQAADLVAVADYLAEHHGVSRKRVALVGRAHGGYAALRTLQLYPGRFRCAVTREAWIRQSGLFEAVLKGQPLAQAEDGFVPVLDTPVSAHPELIKVPVFTLASRSDRQAFHANARLHAAVKDRAPDSELLEIPEHTGDTPKELAKQWARIESFLNFVLYDYRVDLGDLEILPDRPEAGKRP